MLPEPPAKEPHHWHHRPKVLARAENGARGMRKAEERNMEKKRKEKGRGLKLRPARGTLFVSACSAGPTRLPHTARSRA